MHNKSKTFVSSHAEEQGEEKGKGVRSTSSFQGNTTSDLKASQPLHVAQAPTSIFQSMGLWGDIEDINSNNHIGLIANLSVSVSCEIGFQGVNICKVTDSYSAQHLKANKYWSWKKASSKKNYDDKNYLSVSRLTHFGKMEGHGLSNLLQFGEDLLLPHFFCQFFFYCKCIFP